MPTRSLPWSKVASVVRTGLADAMPGITLAGVLTVAAAVANVPALSLCNTAEATVVEALDLDTLVKDADEVVLARVIKQWSLYDERGRIVTDFQMQVEESVKGGALPGSAVIVRKLGGVVGDRGMRISGEPSFTEGETVLVFASHGKKPYMRPIGMGQGTMRVYDKDGQRWARSDAQGMQLTKRGDTTAKSRAALAEPRKLSELLEDVKAIVAAQR